MHVHVCVDPGSADTPDVGSEIESLGTHDRCENAKPVPEEFCHLAVHGGIEFVERCDVCVGDDEKMSAVVRVQIQHGETASMPSDEIVLVVTSGGKSVAEYAALAFLRGTECLYVL